jgi:hypothetical protein
MSESDKPRIKLEEEDIPIPEFDRGVGPSPVIPVQHESGTGLKPFVYGTAHFPSPPQPGPSRTNANDANLSTPFSQNQGMDTEGTSTIKARVGSDAVKIASDRRRKYQATFSCEYCDATFTAKHNLNSKDLL